jgi:hypothetical protein
LDAKFKTLGIFKVKDLANSSFTQVGQMPLGDDPIAVLYGALEVTIILLIIIRIDFVNYYYFYFFF